jgi:DNA adenine methylase
MGIPHPIPYQGSKRALARAILAYFPKDTERLIEPFAGSAAVSLAAAYYGRCKTFNLNDVNKALMRLWEEIINRPDSLVEAYAKIWLEQRGQERLYYDHIRDEFNRTQRPDYLLYLLARCVKAAIRYNANGDFNQSPDNRRKGAHPNTMRHHILGASQLLQGRCSLKSVDYREALREAKPEDIVYMDPPYQGVCSNRDPRYIRELEHNEFVDTLYRLNRDGISYILSYDGRNDFKAYGRPLPETLDLQCLEIHAGRSSQTTLLGRCAYTVESLYLSPSLVARLDKVSTPEPTHRHTLTLPLDVY